jgi:hypothetical protein
MSSQQEAGSAAPPPPEVAGVRLRPALTVGLYVLLVASAGLALWVQRRPGAGPTVVVQAAPWVFLLFALGFAAYRLALVAARRYSPFKAFFQVLITAVFFMLLLPVQWGEVTARPATGLPALLGDPNARVRLLAAEVARYRQDVSVAPQLVKLLDDPSADVRQEAHRSLVALNGGADLAPADDPQAVSKWGERFK